MTLERDAKLEGKLMCAFKNDMKNLANFHQSTLERLWWDPFIQRGKCMSLKFTWELCHDEEWCNIWRRIDPSTRKSQILHFNGLLLTKVYNVWAKKEYRGVMLDDTEDWCKILRKTEEFGKFFFTGWKIAISF